MDCSAHIRRRTTAQGQAACSSDSPSCTSSFSLGTSVAAQEQDFQHYTSFPTGLPCPSGFSPKADTDARYPASHTTGSPSLCNSQVTATGRVVVRRVGSRISEATQLLLQSCLVTFLAISLASPAHAQAGAISSSSIPPATTTQSFLRIAEVKWGKKAIEEDGTVVLAISSPEEKGGGWVSREPFFHGVFKARVKVPATPSCGVVTAFYLTSEWNSSWPHDMHDEIDFEVLGDDNSGDLLLQTNYFLGGVGGHEERLRFWFDPTLDFHEYKFVVNTEGIRWYVDDILVREVTKDTHAGVLPTTSLFLTASLWDGSSWVPCNSKRTDQWNAQLDLTPGKGVPFVASFKDVGIDACYWRQMDSSEVPECARPDGWAVWDAKVPPKDRVMLEFVKSHYRVFTWEAFHPRGTGNWIVGRDASRVMTEAGMALGKPSLGGLEQQEFHEKMLRGGRSTSLVR